ncbi:MAG: hypothetical protein QW585_01985, partial [Candidatus Pacearchaeota archaeon]
MVTKSKLLLLAAAVIFLVVFSFASVSAVSVTTNFYPKWGIDTTHSSGYYIMNSSDLAKVNLSDDNRYESKGYWPCYYNDSEYIQWNFTENLPNVTIINASLTFEWQRTGSTDAEARLRVWDHTAGSWSTWYNLSAPNANQDYNFTVNLFSFINTVSDINNFKVQFQAKDGSGAKTKHDLVQLTVTYEVPDTEAPDTNITHVRNISLSNEKECVWNGTHFNVIVPYNQIITYGVSVDDHGVNTQDNSPQYVWDSLPITGWTNVITYSGNHGDQIVYWRTSQGDWNTQLKDGLHRVCGRAKDTSNNQENPGNGGPINVWLLPNDDCCDVCVDTQAPTQPEKPWLSNPSQCVPNYINENPVFRWTASSDEPNCSGIAYYEVEVYYSNGTLYMSYNENDTETKFPGENGQGYYIRVRAIDKAGNHGPWSDYSEEVYVDTDKPEVNITAPEQGTWFNTNFDVSETDTDANLWKCYYKIVNEGTITLDWTETACNENVTIDISAYCPRDGNCTVHKNATDKACNSKSTHKWYKVDRTPPVTTKTVGEPNVDNTYITSETPIMLECNDSGVGCNMTCYEIVNSSGVVKSNCQVAPYNFTFNDLADGWYTLYFWSNDSLGNTEERKNQTHYLDNTGPTVSKQVNAPRHPYPNKYGMLDNGFYVTNHTVFTFNCNDEGVDQAIVYWQIQNGPQGHGNAPLNVTFDIADGEFNLSYYCVDALGNLGLSRNETDYMDNTPPEITIINPTENASIGCELFVFSVRAIILDAGSGVDGSSVFAELINSSGNVLERVKLTYENGKWFGNINHLYPAGDYIVKIIASDNVGNEKTEERNIRLIYDVFWYVHPASVELTINSSETASFSYMMYLCHGGNAIAMQMEKLCGSNGEWLNPILKNATTTKAVEEINESWNFNETSLSIGTRNNMPKNGTVTLQFNAPQSTPRCDSLNYLIGIGFDDEENPRSIIGTSFDIIVRGNKVIFSPKGPIGA